MTYKYRKLILIDVENPLENGMQLVCLSGLIRATHLPFSPVSKREWPPASAKSTKPILHPWQQPGLTLSFSQTRKVQGCSQKTLWYLHLQSTADRGN